MKRASFLTALLVSAVVSLLLVVSPRSISAQSRPQRPDAADGNTKRNQRPKPKTEEELKAEAEAKRIAEEEKNATVEEGVTELETNIVNLDAVVFDKKTKQIITGLKKENFAVFENGVKQNIANFSTPEAPITVTLVVEYSRWSEIFGSALGRRWEPGMYEVVRPVASFLSTFIKPPNDYASVIAFDLRPTPITDFTNDPQQIRDTISLLLRNNPAYKENNLFDSVKFALVGGKGDSVVLSGNDDYDKGKQAEYGGMVSVKSRRRAIILVASGINTFSRTSYGEARKIVSQAGVPVYIISTGNLFYKTYENQLPPETNIITGMPGRLDFLQAKNTLQTLAKESGGMFFEMTYPGEIPQYLNTINGLLRSQYNLSYDLAEKHDPNGKYKIEVKVDVNGDGIYDEKQYTVQHRPYYTPMESKKNPPAVK